MFLQPYRQHLLICVLFASAVGYAAIENAAPIYVANQNPFVVVYGLPKAEAGSITPKGKLDAGFLYFVANNAIDAEAGNGERAVWDGETAQYTFRLRCGVTDYLELGADIPFLQHSGGYLDSVIRNYHKMFGFPNDRQEQFDKNQIHYEISDGGNVLYSKTDSSAGLGDIRLTAALPLFREALHSRRHLAIRSLLKLPTGDSGELLGSGALDAALGIAYSDHETLQKANMAFAAQLGLIYTGDSDILPALQKNMVGYGGASAAWEAFDWLSLKLQLDLHSAFYDSELQQLGSSLQLLAGGAVRLPAEMVVDFGISEQLITDATPDVGFYLFVQHLF